MNVEVGKFRIEKKFRTKSKIEKFPIDLVSSSSMGKRVFLWISFDGDNLVNNVWRSLGTQVNKTKNRPWVCVYYESCKGIYIY